MKTKQEIWRMLERVETSKSLGSARGPLIMALEWVLIDTISTSQGFEDWLDEAEGEVAP